jgi:hypothetical protein
MAYCVAYCKVTGANRVSTRRIQLILDAVIPEANKMLGEKRTESIIRNDGATSIITTFFKEGPHAGDHMAHRDLHDISHGHPFEVTVTWEDYEFHMEVSVRRFKLPANAPAPFSLHWKVMHDEFHHFLNELHEEYKGGMKGE